MAGGRLDYAILNYIVDQVRDTGGDVEDIKLPPMDELAASMGGSRGKLREELLAAQAYGIVEMRPGDGTYVRGFDFHTPVRTLVLYAIACDRANFDRVYELRKHLEISFWDSAVANLTPDDLDGLRDTIERAEQRLGGTPVEIPHGEHRDFHMGIFSKLDNEFVLGLLRAYWEAYEAVGLHRYFEYQYYARMWSSHKAMVDAIADGRIGEGKKIVAGHFTLLQTRLDGERDVA